MSSRFWIDTVSDSDDQSVGSLSKNFADIAILFVFLNSYNMQLLYALHLKNVTVVIAVAPVCKSIALGHICLLCETLSWKLPYVPFPYVPFPFPSFQV